MRAANCPNCGCQRDGGEECLRCGIVFAKFFIRAQPAPSPPPTEAKAQPGSGTGPRFLFRVVRSVTLASLLMAGYLLVQPSPSPITDFQPTAEQSAEFKIRQFRRAALSGRERRLRLSEAELNSWLRVNLHGDRGSERAEPSPASDAVGDDPPAGAMERFLSAVRDVRVKLIDDRVMTHVRFVVYGKILSFELEGRVAARGGYVHLDPVSGRLGSLPLPGPPVAVAVDRLLRSPGNREALRIPDYVRAIGVDDGQLLVNFQEGER